MWPQPHEVRFLTVTQSEYASGMSFFRPRFLVEFIRGKVNPADFQIGDVPTWDGHNFTPAAQSGGGGGGGITKKRYVAKNLTTFPTIPVGGGTLTFNTLLHDDSIDVSPLDDGFTATDYSVNPASYFNVNEGTEGLYIVTARVQGVPAGASDGQLSVAAVWSGTDGTSEYGENSYLVSAARAAQDTPFFTVSTPPVWITGVPFDIGIPAYSFIHVAVVWNPDDATTEFNTTGGDVTITKLA